MNKKLIALDLDGTLLREDKTISKRTKTYLKELEDRGNIIVLASGRSPRAIIHHYESMSLHSPYIAYNGNYLNDTINREETIFKKIGQIFLKSFFDRFSFDHFSYVSVESLDNLYMLKEDDRFEDFIFPKKTNLILGDIKKNVNEDLMSFIFQVKDKDIKDDIEKFASEDEDIKLRFWYDLDDYGEFYPSSISKATSLEKLIKDHQIKREDVIAIGDGNNDFEMLSLASLSFAMKNGSAELKSKSRYVTEYTNDEDGVYHVLKDLFD